MDPSNLDSPHFTRALAELGERRTVVAHSAIHNQQGLKIIEKGVAVNARLYEQLTQHRLRQPLADSLSVEDSVSAYSVRDHARELAAAEPLFGALLATPRAGEALLDELPLVPLPQPVALQLTTMRETQPELWQHSLRSALLAGWLAHRSGGSRFDVRMLCAAGLLHDLGMLHLDPALLRAETVFNADLRRQLHSHPLLTVMLLERHHEYPRQLLQAVLDHHESLDGSGYPRRVSGASASRWGKVLSITEVVTALAAPSRGASSARLSLALRMNQGRFDAALVRELMPLLASLHGATLPPEGDPATRLLQLDAVLRAWPATLEPAPATARVDALRQVHERCAAVLRMLADVGVAAPQLAQLDDGDHDPALAAELDLIAQEAAWQLAVAARLARQLWQLGADESYPDWLDAWLVRAEQPAS